jgi:hypothetical protein
VDFLPFFFADFFVAFLADFFFVVFFAAFFFGLRAVLFDVAGVVVVVVLVSVVGATASVI